MKQLVGQYFYFRLAQYALTLNFLTEVIAFQAAGWVILRWKYGLTSDSFCIGRGYSLSEMLFQ